MTTKPNVSVRLPPDLAAAIDRLRGDVPRERWIRRALSTLVAELSKSP